MRTRIQRRASAILPLAILILPSLASAHVGIGPTRGWLNGFWHPFSGLDHVCAMVAVGLWAAQRRGHAIWLIPLTFVTVMTLGGIVGMAGIAIPFVERGVVISVLILGVLVAAATRLPMVASTLIVGLFAVFHGHAHGAEMPQTASGFSYGAGFVAATTLLHACGIAIALGVSRLGQSRFVRLAGLGIAMCGVYLLLG